MQREKHPQGPVPPRPGRRNVLPRPNPSGYAPRSAREVVADTMRHAHEIRALSRGRDFVEGADPDAEKRPPQFDRKELQVVRSWAKRRPLEPNSPAPAMIEYPRMWTTKRGRYCKFKAPGANSYALVRARPTF